MSSVQASCKVCGNLAPADDFKLHFEYKKMVCPACFSGKTKKKEEDKKKIEEKIRPVGWDAEDEYLTKISKQKTQDRKAQFKKIPGTQYVRCTCLSCKFQFRYDPFKKRPRTCPYCDNDIPKFKTFSLL